MKPSTPHTQKRDLVFTLFAMIAVFLAIVYFATTFDVRRASGDLSGKPAPDIGFKMPTGEQSSLASLKGKVVMLNFWASWCDPCTEEMPSLRRLEEHYKEKGFVLLAFNLEDAQEDIRGKIDISNYPKNLIYDYSYESLRPYDVRAIPVSVLIDKAGQVHEVFHGPRDWMDAGIIGEIDKLLR